NAANLGYGAAVRGMVLIGIIYCSNGILTGRVSVGTLTAVMHLMNQVRGPFANISGYLPRWYAMLASAERLMEIESFADDGTPMDGETIRKFYKTEFRSLGLRGASFAYPGGENGLHNADLEIRKGEYVALVGPSGCGKTTALKLLMCLYPLDKGERFINDEPLTAEYRRLFAYVPQGNALMNGTVRQAISLADPSAADDDARIEHALSVACADEFVTEPDAELGERGSGLSEGQIQRLAIARAVFSEAPILILDEATSALDIGTEERLLHNLRSMTDKTVIIVTHRKAALDICDRVLRFDSNGAEQE
ncbi:MAG: ABC transporter ATP-binding protein, partial [Firmicutes bacterium]|nr:ABC transporter ATP-binding protein [Bacillota bacterium]